MNRDLDDSEKNRKVGSPYFFSRCSRLSPLAQQRQCNELPMNRTTTALGQWWSGSMCLRMGIMVLKGRRSSPPMIFVHGSCLSSLQTIGKEDQNNSGPHDRTDHQCSNIHKSIGKFHSPAVWRGGETERTAGLYEPFVHKKQILRCAY